MELYQKPVMEITELEKTDVLTMSCECPICSLTETTPTYYFKSDWSKHMVKTHPDYVAANPDYITYYDIHAKNHSGTTTQSTSQS